MNALVRRTDSLVAPVIPAWALNALQRIRVNYPDAFIAGGFLRDLYHGVEPKDLDVFTFQLPKEEENDSGIDKSQFYKLDSHRDGSKRNGRRR
jgi:hypothetical protein